MVARGQDGNYRVPAHHAHDGLSAIETNCEFGPGDAEDFTNVVIKRVVANLKEECLFNDAGGLALQNAE